MTGVIHLAALVKTRLAFYNKALLAIPVINEPGKNKSRNLVNTNSGLRLNKA